MKLSAGVFFLMSESSPNLLPQVGVESVLMKPLRLKEWGRVLVVQRETACLSISAVQKITACLADTRRPPQSSKVPVEESEQVESHKREPNSLSSMPDLISETSRLVKCISGVKDPRVGVVRLKQWHRSARPNPRSLLPV